MRAPICGSRIFWQPGQKSQADSATSSANCTHVEKCVAWADCGRHEVEPCAGIRNDVGMHVWVGITLKVNSDRRFGDGVALDCCSQRFHNNTFCSHTRNLVGGHGDAIRCGDNSFVAVCYRVSGYGTDRTRWCRHNTSEASWVDNNVACNCAGTSCINNNPGLCVLRCGYFITLYHSRKFGGRRNSFHKNAQEVIIVDTVVLDSDQWIRGASFRPDANATVVAALIPGCNPVHSPARILVEDAGDLDNST